MYYIKSEFCEKLLKLSDKNYPKRKVIEEYMARNRGAQEVTVRALAAELGEADWKELVCPK